MNFESADAGASLTYPQQAGTIRKNAFIVIKNRPCKVRFASPPAAGQSRPQCKARPWHAAKPTRLRVRQVVDVSTSKTGKHGHAKCHFVAIDIFTGKKLEDLQPSSHNCDVSPHTPSTVSARHPGPLRRSLRRPV